MELDRVLCPVFMVWGTEFRTLHLSIRSAVELIKYRFPGYIARLGNLYS